MGLDVGIDIRVLGSTRVKRDGVSLRLGRQARCVLALLALHGGEPVTTDALIAALWPDRVPRTAKVHVQGLIYSLRRALGSGHDRPIATEPAGYALRLDPDELDLHRFNQARARAGQADTPQEAEHHYRRALQEWAGRPCIDLDLPAIAQLAEPLVETYLDTLEAWSDVALCLGDAVTVAALLRPAVAAHPFRERLRGLLMTALYRAGRTAEALRVYDEGRRHLVTELGIDPCAELQDLHRAVLRGTLGARS